LCLPVSPYCGYTKLALMHLPAYEGRRCGLRRCRASPMPTSSRTSPQRTANLNRQQQQSTPAAMWQMTRHVADDATRGRRRDTWQTTRHVADDATSFLRFGWGLAGLWLGIACSDCGTTAASRGRCSTTCSSQCTRRSSRSVLTSNRLAYGALQRAGRCCGSTVVWLGYHAAGDIISSRMWIPCCARQYARWHCHAG
jgi:hypothetical protein